MTRAALYARYSSDRQNERSVEDQLAVCRQHAAARGWDVVAAFTDAAISGATMANRPGLLALLASAETGAFEVLLVEDTDRLARNREHDAHVYNRLTRAGVAIATLSTDRVTVIDSALRGLMNELYLTNLSAKTSRGMRANAEAGRATGARTYGYRSQPGGAVEIVPAEAAIIREVFKRYAAGETPREIAADLNRRGAPSTFGRGWAANMIGGSHQRGNGILHNELYVGVKVWNRMTVTKDPETGRRRPRMKPRGEWRRTPVLQLRIVSDAAWTAAHARKDAERSHTPGHLSARRKALFSGLLKCGCCGASYTSFSKLRLVCANAREKGECRNWAQPRRQMVEQRILAGLQQRLATPEAAEAYMQAYRRAWDELAGERGRERTLLERRLAELGRRIDRLVDDVCEGRITAAGREKLAAHEAEKVEAAARLAALAAAAEPVRLHPAAPAQYAALIADLRASLPRGAHDPESRQLFDAIRALVLRVDITPDPAAAEGFAITVVGDLARFLEPAGAIGCKLVAGGGFSRTPSIAAPFAA